MADFLTNLWTSVFTPGPTPTLLVATNATFAVLQLLLLVLLVATYSIHFVVLSVLSAGLWWSINWFARELMAAQEKEEEAKRIRGARRGQGGSGSSDRARTGRADSGDDTDTETEGHGTAPRNVPPGISKDRPVPRSSRATPEKGGGFQPNVLQQNRPRSGAPLQPGTGAASGSTLAPPAGADLTKRRSSGDLAELSTDSEWEKVDDDQ